MEIFFAEIPAIPALVAAGAAYLWGKRRGENSVPEVEEYRSPKPVCQCEHGYALHGEDGVCGVTVTETVLVERGSPKSISAGRYGDMQKIVYEHEKWESHERKCGCRRYTGPEPMPTVVAL